MMRMKTSLNISVIIILLLSIWALFFITGTFSVSLTPPDEPKYAYAAYKMFETGDFITPFFNDEPRFDKPPLIYWFIAILYNLFGVSDWAARVPSIISILGVIIFIYLFCKKEFVQRTGIIAVLVFSTNFHVWMMGRAVAPEATLVLFEVISLYCFYNGIEEQNKIYIYAGYLSLSLAFLTKGPVGVIIPLSIIVIYFVLRRGIRDTLKKILDPAGILIFAVISLPWYIVMLRKYGYPYFKEFFLFHNLYRFTGASHQHPFKFYYYIPIFLGSLFLWLPFIQEVKNYLKGVLRNKGKEIFFVIWALFPLIFFSVSFNKLHNYILISYPAVSVIFGDCLSRIEYVSKTVKKLFLGAIIVEAFLLILSLYYLKHTYSFYTAGVMLILAISIIMILRATSVWRISIFTMLNGFCILLLLVVFFAADKQARKEAYACVNYEANIEKEKVFFYKTSREDFCFYDNISIPYLQNKIEIKELLKRHGEIVLIIKSEHVKDLQDIKKFNIGYFTDFSGDKSYSIIEIST